MTTEQQLAFFKAFYELLKEKNDRTQERLEREKERENNG